MPTISYAILVNDEYTEIKFLTSYLLERIDTEDEIVIIQDNYNKNIEMTKFLADLQSKNLNQIKVYPHNLNNDFAAQKNFLNSKCTKDYIFNLDADEYVNSEFITDWIKEILKSNPDIDAFWLHRVNIVKNITSKDINNWGWHVSKLEEFKETRVMGTLSDEYEFIQNKGLVIEEGTESDLLTTDGYAILVKYYIPIINWPYDPQLRLYKNKSNIKWERPVHEYLTGYKTVTRLPAQPELSILHIKNIDKQRQQNKHYEEIIKYKKYGFEVQDFNLNNEYQFKYAHWKHPTCHKRQFKIETIKWFRNIIKEGDYVIDIGAFIGDTPVIYGNTVGKSGKVIAFEPNPYAYQILLENAKLNKDIMNIQPVNLGISEKTGKYTFHYSDDNYCNGGYAEKTEYGVGVTGHRVPLEVNCTNLMDWLDTELSVEEINKITFIKIDSEGYDRFILDSMSDLLKEIRPVIATEIYTGLSENEIKLQLESIIKLGYIPFHIPEYYNKDVVIDIFNLNKPLSTQDAKYLKDNIISGEDILCIPEEKYKNKEK